MEKNQFYAKVNEIFCSFFLHFFAFSLFFSFCKLNVCPFVQPYNDLKAHGTCHAYENQCLLHATRYLQSFFVAGIKNRNINITPKSVWFCGSSPFIKFTFYFLGILVKVVEYFILLKSKKYDRQFYKQTVNWLYVGWKLISEMVLCIS